MYREKKRAESKTQCTTLPCDNDTSIKIIKSYIFQNKYIWCIYRSIYSYMIFGPPINFFSLCQKF